MSAVIGRERECVTGSGKTIVFRQAQSTCKLQTSRVPCRQPLPPARTAVLVLTTPHALRDPKAQQEASSSATLSGRLRWPLPPSLCSGNNRRHYTIRHFPPHRPPTVASLLVRPIPRRPTSPPKPSPVRKTTPTMRHRYPRPNWPSLPS